MYLQDKVHHRYQDTGGKFTTGINDTSGKFPTGTAGVNDSNSKYFADVNGTGGKLPPASTTLFRLTHAQASGQIF
jgi:hypothetical protein